MIGRLCLCLGLCLRLRGRLCWLLLRHGLFIGRLCLCLGLCLCLRGGLELGRFRRSLDQLFFRNSRSIGKQIENMGGLIVSFCRFTHDKGPFRFYLTISYILLTRAV